MGSSTLVQASHLDRPVVHDAPVFTRSAMTPIKLAHNPPRMVTNTAMGIMLLRYVAPGSIPFRKLHVRSCGDTYTKRPERAVLQSDEEPRTYGQTYVLAASTAVSTFAVPVLSTQNALIDPDADPFVGTHAAHATFEDASPS